MRKRFFLVAVVLALLITSTLTSVSLAARPAYAKPTTIHGGPPSQFWGAKIPTGFAKFLWCLELDAGTDPNGHPVTIWGCIGIKNGKGYWQSIGSTGTNKETGAVGCVVEPDAGITPEELCAMNAVADQ